LNRLEINVAIISRRVFIKQSLRRFQKNFNIFKADGVLRMDRKMAELIAV
jgi:hypothetical protein